MGLRIKSRIPLLLLACCLLPLIAVALVGRCLIAWSTETEIIAYVDAGCDLRDARFGRRSINLRQGMNDFYLPPGKHRFVALIGGKAFERDVVIPKHQTYMSIYDGPPNIILYD